jgi:hypothetical protein
MEEKPPSNANKPRPLAEIELPAGEGPQAHALRFLNPRDREKHFAALLGNVPGRGQLGARNAKATSFAGHSFSS